MKTLELIPSKLLPHRAPMLLIDEVLETDYDKNITVQTTVGKDHFFFQGHFPDYPLLPGIAMIEMMFQTCGILSRVRTLSNESGLPEKKRIGKAVRIKTATFLKEVFPETTLIIRAERIKQVLSFSEYKATVSAGDQKVCEAILIVTI